MDPRNEGHTICFSANLVGREGCFFQLLKSDFFLNKVKAFIFVTIKSFFFTIAIRPYTSLTPVSSSKYISDQHSSKFY